MENIELNLPVYPSKRDKIIRENSEISKRTICSTIEEMIVRLKNKDFYSVNFDDYVCLGDGAEIHYKDYIKALEDLKFKIKSQGDWVD